MTEKEDAVRELQSPWQPALHSAEFMRGVGRGNLCKLHRPATDHDPGRLALRTRDSPRGRASGRKRGAPRQRDARRVLETLSDDWRGRNFPPGGRLGRAVFEERVLSARCAQLSGGGALWQLVERAGILARAGGLSPR